MLDIYFENNDTVAFSWEEAITIEETGMYYLWFVICDDELSAATVRGQTTWKNPTGARRRLAVAKDCQGPVVQPDRLDEPHPLGDPACSSMGLSAQYDRGMCIQCRPLRTATSGTSQLHIAPGHRSKGLSRGWSRG